MEIVVANLWNLNPNQLRAIDSCLLSKPDVLVLPELRNNCIAAAQKLLNSKGYTLIHAHVHRLMSLGVASRIPIQYSEIINQEPFIGRPQIKLQLETGIIFLGIHLDAPVSPYRYKQRQKQLLFLSEFIKQSLYPVILAGDFNTYFREAVFQTLLTEIGSLPLEKINQRPRSWPSILPLFQIDHILCSQQLQLTNLKQGNFNGSDHLPIHAYLEKSIT